MFYLSEEYEKGEIRNKFGEILLRGNNVLYISAKFNKPSEPI
jgi:small nuclear ribonucleoprotein (snRNP)-like protein